MEQELEQRQHPPDHHRKGSTSVQIVVSDLHALDDSQPGQARAGPKEYYLLFPLEVLHLHDDHPKKSELRQRVREPPNHQTDLPPRSGQAVELEPYAFSRLRREYHDPPFPKRVV
jgi:hypothetical protein